MQVLLDSTNLDPVENKTIVKTLQLNMYPVQDRRPSKPHPMQWQYIPVRPNEGKLFPLPPILPGLT